MTHYINKTPEVQMAELKKDLEYLIKAQEKTQSDLLEIISDVQGLKAFYQKWKGGAVVLMALGGIVTYVIDSVIKVLPFLDK